MIRFETDALELAWIVGIIEGEGSIGYSKGSVLIQIASTDRDVVERCAKFMDVNVLGPYKKKENEKPVYMAVMYGATTMLMDIYPYMSDHRRKQIETALKTKLEVAQCS